MKYTVLASLLLSAVGAQQAYATCYGNVYSLNAGRGHVGILVDVQESDKLTNTYNGDRALAVSPCRIQRRSNDLQQRQQSPLLCQLTPPYCLPCAGVGKFGFGRRIQQS